MDEMRRAGLFTTEKYMERIKIWQDNIKIV